MQMGIIFSILLISFLRKWCIVITWEINVSKHKTFPFICTKKPQPSQWQLDGKYKWKPEDLDSRAGVYI
jgi:hypothetical protein